mgnify:CR=1 FL=1|tara:strand:- start:397 stop:1044 length:648 start_codon:yes stop_codon:yes gene_type:complete
MSENFIEAQYDITKKSKLKRFYETNKILILSFILILFILLVSFGFYFRSLEKNRTLLSENYVQAKIYLEEGDNQKAVNILKDVIYENDATYSTLSFFLLLNQNLIKDYNELKVLFDHMLKNNKYDKEVKNLLIYKKALFSSDFISELELLSSTKPLLEEETVWKSHALMLLGDYFVNKKEYLKASEFYQQILSINNLQQDLYNETLLKLSLIKND